MGKKSNKVEKGKQKTLAKQEEISMPILNPNAAGIDIGGKSHFVCVAQDKVKEFKAFTEDLHLIAKHLKNHKITTVAIESTGPYWKQLFVILRDYGFETILINARHLKNVKGHKTDVVDSKWIQLLHSIGILSNSFQPDSFTEELRTYSRQREYLIRNSTRYIGKMKKSLILMNIRLDNVLSDITGKSGITVIESIISGNRDIDALAKMFHHAVKASKEDIKKALTGNWKTEYIFELQQSYELYNTYLIKIRECDIKIDKLLANYMVDKQDKNKQSVLEYNPKKKKQKQKNSPDMDIFKYAYLMADGVDLSEIPGVGNNLILSIISETGLDLKKSFSSHKKYTSWLGFVPINKISGGKLLSSHTQKKKSTLKKAYKDAANAAGNSNTPLGDFFRRIAYHKGRSVAIVATARKIATSIYVMLDKKAAYEYGHSQEKKEKLRNNQVKNLRKKVKQLDLTKQEIKDLLSLSAA